MSENKESKLYFYTRPAAGYSGTLNSWLMELAPLIDYAIGRIADRSYLNWDNMDIKIDVPSPYEHLVRNIVQHSFYGQKNIDIINIGPGKDIKVYFQTYIKPIENKTDDGLNISFDFGNELITYSETIVMI